MPPPRVGESSRDYEPYQAVDEPPRVRQDPPGQDPRWWPGPPQAPPGRSGSYAPAPPEFGHAPGPDSWPAAHADAQPLTGQESSRPRHAAVRADLPDGPAGGGEPREPRGSGLDAPEWLRSADGLPTAAGAGHPSAGPETQLETLDSFPSPRARRRKRRLATAAVVAVAVLAGIVLFLTRQPGGNTGHAAGRTPAGSKTTQAGGTRSPGGGPAGPGSVSTALVFPHVQVTAGGMKFGRVSAVLNEQCALAARGAFAAALKSAGCQRVARATFVDRAKRYAVTAGVAELPSPAAARRADRSADFGPDVWFTGLDGPAKSGATRVSKSVGLGCQTVYGRYIVYALATYSDGRNPTGHAAAVKTLKDLAKSFTSMTRGPLTAPGG